MKLHTTTVIRGAIFVGAILLTACGGGADEIDDQNQPQAAPVITVQPVIQYVKPGQAATFSVLATGTGPLHYQWKRNGANVGSDLPSYTTPATTTENNGEKYLVVVSNAVGSVTSTEVTLSVNSNDLPVVIQNPPQNISVTEGETATFSVVASGTAPLNYQWKRNGSNVGSNLPGYTTPALTLADNGAAFTVVVSNAVNSKTSTPATLTVNAASVAPTITTQPVSVTVTEGEMASLSVAAAGTGPLHYQWRKGTAVIGTDSASLIFSNALTTDSGNYTVTVSNAVGSVTSGAATLTVNAAATVSVGVGPANATMKTGATRTFTASVAGSSDKGVTWTATGGTITDGGVYTAPPAAGDYVVRATSRADDSAYGEAAVKVTAADHQIRALFLGNSFTNQHHLSAQVEGLAKAAGLDFYAEEHTIGAANLKTLWDEPNDPDYPNSREIIQKGTWDFVVLEPFWHAYDIITKEQELVYAQYFDTAIKAKGARTVIYSTWALGDAAIGKPTDADRQYTYDREETADLGNHWMAQQLEALEVRVGDAWQVSYLRYPSLPLYEGDHVHPTNTGHYFTAALFLIALTGVDPTGNTYIPPPSGDEGLDVVSEENAELMRKLAWELKY